MVNCSKPVWQVRSRFQSSLWFKTWAAHQCDTLPYLTAFCGRQNSLHGPHSATILFPFFFFFSLAVLGVCCSAGASLGVAQRVSCPVACEILGSWPRIKPTSPCIGKWILNCWTPREVPPSYFQLDVSNVFVLLDFLELLHLSGSEWSGYRKSRISQGQQIQVRWP